jgi:RHS repeat-associated protein
VKRIARWDCARDAYSLSFYCGFAIAISNAPALAGTHALTARATDSAGGVTTSAAVNITVTSSSAPTLSFTSPTASASFTTPASVPLVVIATPAAGTTITRIEVYSGATLIGATNSNTLNTNWLTLNPGAQTLTARAIDSNGGVATATVAINVTAAANETITFLHNDLAGSPMAATNLAGTAVWKEDYRPFGERQQNEAASSNQRQWFGGKPQDSETGLSYFGARYYDPVVGRFMGVDAVGFNPGNLQSFNRYAYGNNNPYKYRDRDGNLSLLIEGLIVLGVGTIVTVAVLPKDDQARIQEGVRDLIGRARRQLDGFLISPGQGPGSFSKRRWCWFERQRTGQSKAGSATIEDAKQG